ncbi:MAG: hypothetical protein J6M54_01015, partial [Prevotella sp.]|nr:hypothetical protein [Prevotella sp.]
YSTQTMTMEICKTDIKAIIGFLDDAATLVDEECQRRSQQKRGYLLMHNKARLMRLMKQKLERKL